MAQVDITNFLSIVEFIGLFFILGYGFCFLFIFNSLVMKYKALFRLQIKMVSIISLVLKKNKIKSNFNWLFLLK